MVVDTRKIKFLLVLYSHIKYRVTNPKTLKHIRLYKGLPLCTKEEFLTFTKTNEDFHTLWDAWNKEGRPRRLVPTVDRIDSTLGYVLGNMRWVSLSINSKHVRYELRKIENRTSKFQGVKKDPREKKWRARIKINYKEIDLGAYDTELQAYAAYLKAKGSVI